MQQQNNRLTSIYQELLGEPVPKKTFIHSTCLCGNYTTLIDFLLHLDFASGE